MRPEQYTSIGGQAVIEGVMMRSPRFLAVAVRTPDRTILLRHLPYRSVLDRYPILKRPLLRGIAVLLESLFQGMDALSFSASVTNGERPGADSPAPSSAAIAGSIFFAVLIALGLFVVLPHFLTALLGLWWGPAYSPGQPVFHFIDGAIKAFLLLAYVYGIAQLKDIYRVFQYHGAEHKTVFAFELGQPLTVAAARKCSRLHPRCGTSFLLFLVVLSVLIFSVIFPVMGWARFSSNGAINHGAMVAVKAALMLPVAGIAYEFMRYAAARSDRSFWKGVLFPGLLVQRLTTREPTDEQLEVALAAMRQVLRLEKGVRDENRGEEFTIRHLDELGTVSAQVMEFPEP